MVNTTSIRLSAYTPRPFSRSTVANHPTSGLYTRSSRVFGSVGRVGNPPLPRGCTQCVVYSGRKLSVPPPSRGVYLSPNTAAAYASYTTV
jgi:hypothetical protein